MGWHILIPFRITGQGKRMGWRWFAILDRVLREAPLMWIKTLRRERSSLEGDGGEHPRQREQQMQREKQERKVHSVRWSQ